MADNSVLLVVVLDRSGSMASARSDHEGGLRTFLEEQAKQPGDVRVTLVQFDSAEPCEIVEDMTPVADVKPVTLIPRGGTPLLDAVGKSIAHVESRLKETGFSPSQVICMIITDGYENDSHEWTRAQVNARITELEAREWSFLYLGAAKDSWTDASAIGVSQGAFVGYAAAAPQGAYRSLGSTVTRSRQTYTSAVTAAGAAGASVDSAAWQALNMAKAALNFNSAERAQAATGQIVPDGHTNMNTLDDGHTVTVTPSPTPVTDKGDQK